MINKGERTELRLFEVACDEHGVIDARRTYADAVKERREHFFASHKDERTKP